jgi:hypothetical protein
MASLEKHRHTGRLRLDEQTVINVAPAIHLLFIIIIEHDRLGGMPIVGSTLVGVLSHATGDLGETCEQGWFLRSVNGVLRSVNGA